MLYNDDCCLNIDLNYLHEMLNYKSPLKYLKFIIWERCIFPRKADGKMCEQSCLIVVALTWLIHNPFDIMIKATCCFSTVCVGMTFSLSCTVPAMSPYVTSSGTTEFPRQLRATIASHNRRKTILSTSGSGFILCVSHLVNESVWMCVCVCVCVCVFLASRVFHACCQLCITGRSYILLHILFWRGGLGTVVSHGHPISECYQINVFGECLTAVHFEQSSNHLFSLSQYIEKMPIETFLSLIGFSSTTVLKPKIFCFLPKIKTSHLHSQVRRIKIVCVRKQQT